ncbi:hypothetical protein CPC08DRAFT_758257 [Agrocybe pediades]|nr:hypothetical protein CPC08DRAFT_758257 [Agrocybe pediades]
MEPQEMEISDDGRQTPKSPTASPYPPHLGSQAPIPRSPLGNGAPVTAASPRAAKRPRGNDSQEAPPAAPTLTRDGDWMNHTLLPDLQGFMNRPPRDHNLNPALRLTQQGEPPALVATLGAVMFTRERLPVICQTRQTLLGNVAEKQLALFRQESANALILVIHGGGMDYFDKHPNVEDDIKGFLSTWGVQLGNLSVVRAEAANLGRRPAHAIFVRPWVLFLLNIPIQIRDTLLYFETIAISPELTFSALTPEADLNSIPWILLSLEGKFVRNDGFQMRKALATIKVEVAINHAFRTLVHRELMMRGISGSVDEHVLYVTDSWSIYYRTLNMGAERPPKYIWQIEGQPISTDPAVQEQYLTILRNMTFYHDLLVMKSTRAFNNCEYCKSEDHPMGDCAFHRASDWLGPIPDLTLSTEAKPGNAGANVNHDRQYSYRGDNQREGGYGRGGYGRSGRGGNGRGYGRDGARGGRRGW